ncbi:hypothetical protein QUF72_16515 [Desulfobacterales bacterium HSG2]|nr:hypothetical protein [Desulfobacterales bacterium HSG2]
MTFASLNLWADEEQRIHECLKEALRELISKHIVLETDEEKVVTGKLRPLINRVKKRKHLNWTFHPESSSFEKEEDPEAVGHPDIRFSCLDTEYNQYDYDVECKLVRVKRPDAETDYCYNYVKKGVLRYHSEKYAQSFPPMGTMLGYVQAGDIPSLFKTIKQKIKNQQKKRRGLYVIKLKGKFKDGDITQITQHLKREADDFELFHLWADFRDNKGG